ncbi:PREDICTED: filament-like plant protein isoform X2 [Populus euphratica]|uniref:Filament-like plant protein isoform X2 n=1 Tax=Populus euphratica TaxID=75702 RepID=A0AAJ6U3W3_POPEU|nr:PREDICTED: filament-like plant protein isoform X2 [Populus euphratica]
MAFFKDWWEKAENDLSALKQQLEDATKKNSGLEDRVGHLDAALKECVRQLRQSREEQDERINEAVTKKISEWESTKSELAAQLVELQAQLQTAKDEAATSADSDLWKRFDAVEKENMSLKRELLSRAEEIEIRILERDLSTQAAETASKLHLESIKKLAKLEAECRKLKAMARKASAANDYKSLTASSVGGESITDRQSDIGERLLAVESHSCKMSGLGMNERDPSCSDSRACAHVTELDQYENWKPIGRNRTVPSVEINLMDDFLEMERLAAFPYTLSGSSYVEAEPVSDKGSGSPWKEELESMINRTAELEEKLDKMEEEKIKSEMALTKCQRQLETLRSHLHEADTKIGELQAKLALANESRQAREEEMKDIEAKSEETKSQLRIAEAEIKTLLSKVVSLDSEVEKERALSAENAVKSQQLEDELSKMKCEAELQHENERMRVASFNEELKITQEKELAVAASKLADCQKTISSLGLQLKSLATFEDLLFDSEKSSDASSEGSKAHADGEQQKPDPRNLSSGRDSEALQVSKGALRSKKGSNRESSLSLNSSFASEKNRNGFGKFPPRGYSRVRNEN